MKYRESQIDKDLRKRFNHDFAHILLKQIILREGSLRGLDDLDIKFKYPITAIAGKNGAGKSTILALASCAYHNNKDGFKLPKRKNSYYTFSDFFIQHTQEVSPEGIQIEYYFAHDNWKKTPDFPDGMGIGYQRRKKSKGGKWNDYDERVKKNVVFLGIERIVPHSERSQSRSYSRAFIDVPPKGWENKVKDIVGYIIGRQYSNFRYLEYTKYSLPIVQCGDTIYTGFNMGAGENAVFEIFSTIYSCGNGALLVLDEIELGLHAEAQRKLIEKLKEVCLETHTQVICTTHSREIFDSLPYDARYFLEKINHKSKITEGISSDFAFSKLSAIHGTEAELLVEDEVAKAILISALPSVIRSRVSIKIIGSSTALSRQLAAIYIKGEDRPTIAFFDGDQRQKQANNFEHARSMCEKPKDDFQTWFTKRINYLPGESWPEAWLIQRAFDCLEKVSEAVSCDPNVLKDILEYGLQAGKHNEFFEIARQLGTDRNWCMQSITSTVTREFNSDFKEIISQIEKLFN